MDRVLLIRYSEIYLKGKNRGFFINTLFDNIKYAVFGTKCKIVKAQNRIFVEDYEIENEQIILDKLNTVFGIHSISRCYAIKTSKENIFDYFKNFKLEQDTFKVKTSRADKTFEINSMELSSEIGYLILNNNPSASVDVHNPKTEIQIDIRENGYTYIFYDHIKGRGGMPVGTAGNGLVLISGGIDSPVAAYKMAKRGMKLYAIHFHSFPYTSVQAKEKVVSLAKQVQPYTHLHRLFVVSFTKIQESIHKECKSEYMITIMRRIMIRIAERIARKNNCLALITGESLGQVASQTVESITSTNSVAEHLPIFRPLIAMDKEEIIEVARDIKTFEISILPYEDCCTVFLPKNPIIKPKQADVVEEESKLELEPLIKEAIDSVEVINF